MQSSTSNEDDKCFLYSYIAAKYPTDDHKYRDTYYKNKLEELTSTNQLIYDPQDIPMPVNKINKFEKQNDITINLYEYCYENNEILPRRISKRRQENPINLLLL